MIKDYPGEQWKAINLDFPSINTRRIEISNFGRVKSFSKALKPNILNGAMINGYRIIRLKLFTPRDEQKQKYFDALQQQAFSMARRVKALNQSEDTKEQAIEAAKLLEGFKKDLSSKFETDLKSRTVHYHSLTHRLVAEYFCKKPSEEHTVVGHLDYDKLNNKATNLKWMTPAENFVHQQKSPYVIAKKIASANSPVSKVNKLTVTKVMLLKKLLNQGKPIKTLVKQFRITDTQILRIKRGENWKTIEAAP